MNGQGDEVDCTECGRTNKSGSAFCGFCGAKLASSRIDLTDLGDESPAKDPEITLSDSPASKRVGGLILSREIERGGMGVVYEAFDEHLERAVAVKVISPDLAGDERFRKRFIAETRAVASLNNPFILPVYQAGEEEGTLFLITKLANGGDLSSALRKNGPFSPDETATVISEIGEALTAAHEKGMIHRDVKPANVLIDHESGRTRYFLTDFGLTKYGIETSGITNTGEVLGTVDYMAPEQIEGSEVDERVDVYALGCMAVELLTGNPPFRRDSKQATLIAHLNDEPEISGLVGPLGGPSPMDGVLKKALAKNPADRYQSCTAFSGDLTAALEGSTTASEDVTQAINSVPPLAEPISARKKGRTGLMVASLVALLVLIGGGGYVLAGGGMLADPPPQEESPIPDPVPPDGGEEGGGEEEPPKPDDRDSEGGGEQTAEPLTTSLADLAESGEFRNKDDFGGDEILTAGTFADYESETGDYPTIGPREFDDAVVLDGYALGRDEPVEAQATLRDYDFFSGLAGAEASLDSGRVLRLKIEITQGNGNLRTVWDRDLKAGARPNAISFPLRPSDSQITFSVTGEDYVGQYYEETDYVVIANGVFTSEVPK